MGQVWTREDWNQLIRDVNDVLQHPPADTDCSAIEEIDEVDAGHVWAKSDIREVQDKLKQTCTDISFDDIPDKWLQSIIDDINDAKGKAWCHCNPNNPGPNPWPPPVPPMPPGTTAVVIVVCDCSSGSFHVTDENGNPIPICQGCTGSWMYQNRILGTWPISEMGNAYAAWVSYLAGERAAGSPCQEFFLISWQQWLAMYQPGASFVGSCQCLCSR